MSSPSEKKSTNESTKLEIKGDLKPNAKKQQTTSIATTTEKINKCEEVTSIKREEEINPRCEEKSEDYELV